MIKPVPIRIGTKIGLAIENPPRANDIIPKIISNTEAIFGISESEKRLTIPAKISMMPVI